MKKKELKKRIEEGFSELSPDLFEAVLEESRKQEVAWSETVREKPSANGKFNMGRFPRYALSLCASLAIICLCIFGVLREDEKSVFMVLDINPSIQIEVDEAHQVKRLKGLNQDGKDVVKELRWKNGTVQELLDVLIQDVVEKSYLRENGGILVTLAAKDKYVCENLERTLGEGIDRKLTELKVSGVTTAFQEVQSRTERQGRKLLEAELTKSCGLAEEQVQQMSVNELIQYCQDYTSLELKLSEASEKERAAAQDGGGKPQEPSLPEGSGQEPEGDSSKKTNPEKQPGKDEPKTKEPGKDQTKKEPEDKKQDLKEECQDVEGNTDDQKLENSSGTENLEDSAKKEDAIPAGTGNGAVQTGEEGPITSGDVPEQPESGGQSGAGNVLGRPEDSGKPGTESPPSQPEGGMTGTESPPSQPGGSKSEIDDVPSQEDGNVNGQPEEATSGQQQTEQPGGSVQQEGCGSPKRQENKFILDAPA